jgi:hypothetical protein
VSAYQELHEAAETQKHHDVHADEVADESHTARGHSSSTTRARSKSWKEHSLVVGSGIPRHRGLGVGRCTKQGCPVSLAVGRTLACPRDDTYCPHTLQRRPRGAAAQAAPPAARSRTPSLANNSAGSGERGTEPLAKPARLQAHPATQLAVQSCNTTRGRSARKGRRLQVCRPGYA